MKIFALIIFSTLPIRGVYMFSQKETYKKASSFIASLVFLVSSVVAYAWLVNQFVSFK